MRETRLALGVILASWVLTAPALAQDGSTLSTAGRTFVVDDSGTVVLDPYLELQWQPGERTAPSNIVSASTRVSVQLNLAPWSGRMARIYMTLPRTAAPTVRATWSTGGTLLPGSLLSGDRALVMAGPVTAPVVRDLLEMRLEADGNRLGAPQALAFGFEIEVEP